MSTHSIGFTLTTTGHITVEAETEAAAEDKAQELLEHHLNAGQLTVAAPDLDTIRFDDNEVETW